MTVTIFILNASEDREEIFEQGLQKQNSRKKQQLIYSPAMTQAVGADSTESYSSILYETSLSAKPAQCRGFDPGGKNWGPFVA